MTWYRSLAWPIVARLRKFADKTKKSWGDEKCCHLTEPGKPRHSAATCWITDTVTKIHSPHNQKRQVTNDKNTLEGASSSAQNWQSTNL